MFEQLERQVYLIERVQKSEKVIAFVCFVFQIAAAGVEVIIKEGYQTMEIRKGQKVWVCIYQGRTSKIEETIIEAVGRRYITVEACKKRDF